MNVMSRIVTNSANRPYVFLAGTVLLLVLLDWNGGRFLTSATLFSVLQTFATLGPAALGLGMTMLVREFDLSIAGVFGLAGCVAVLTGGSDAALGLLFGILTGALFGLVQGAIITRLRLPSIAVTLGGLLIAVGIAYVLTENQSLVYANLDLALRLNERIATVFSPRSLIALAVFAVAALILGFTRIGRDMIALGSNRRAAETVGLNVKAVLIGTFICSGALAAGSGALLSYSLTSASPSGLSDVLVPAAAAAILGGVSLSGGTGTPAGIAAGVLTLAVMRAGLNAIGAPPYAHDLAMGAILLTVAVLDAPRLMQRLNRVFNR